MKYIIPVALLFIVTVLSIGCARMDDESTAETKQNKAAAVQLNNAITETKEAAQSMQNYAYAQKAIFVDNMKKELVEMQAELDSLSAKVERASGTVKTDAKARLEVVRKKWIQAKIQLDQAQSATESTWEDVKDSFKKLYDDLKESFDNARQWVSDKIEP